jgi:hypothetical protein
MPPLRILDIERVSAEFSTLLGLHDGGVLRIDWIPLIDFDLPKIGIHVYAVDPADIDGDEGATDPAGTGSIDVLLRQDIFDALHDPGPGGNRARATFPHELGHCVLHVGRLRKYRSHLRPDTLLRRVSRGSIPAYADPEWQAWTMAGCLVAPRELLQRLLHLTEDEIARRFGISVAFLQQHLRRLKLSARSPW